MTRTKRPLLVVSTNSAATNSGPRKQPGVRLVVNLSDQGVFDLLDVPSHYYAKSLLELISICRQYIRAMIAIMVARRSEVFFYNLPKAYIPLYLLHVITRFQLPSLFLADGIDCTGMRHNEQTFLRLYERIISLPMNSTLKQLKNAGRQVLWFPGFVGEMADTPRRKETDRSRITLVFNSSLLPHNMPEQVLRLLETHADLSVIVTDTEDNFRNYLSKSLVIHYSSLPQNLFFAGTVEFSEYRCVLENSDGILICRNEKLFANRFNFPSKVIEALVFGTPVVTTCELENVPGELYFQLSDKRSMDELYDFIASRSSKDVMMKMTEFLNLCDLTRLKDWLSAERSTLDFSRGNEYSKLLA